jgi:hypothetical protein
VIELIGAAALHDRDLINHRREAGKHLGEFRPALPMPREAILRPQHRGIRPDEGISLAADHFRRDRLALNRREFRLVVE